MPDMNLLTSATYTSLDQASNFVDKSSRQRNLSDETKVEPINYLVIYVSFIVEDFFFKMEGLVEFNSCTAEFALNKYVHHLHMAKYHPPPSPLPPSIQGFPEDWYRKE